MLAMLAFGMPDAKYFIDSDGYCFWANNRAGDYEDAEMRLESLLGNIDIEEGKTDQRIVESWDSIASYVLERCAVHDEKGRNIGSYLSVRDNTENQKVLQREIYNATHDP